MTGWGQDAFEGEGQLQARLQEVDVPLVGPRECQAALRRSGLGRRFRMHPGWICAGVLLKVAPGALSLFPIHLIIGGDKSLR